MKRIYFLLSFVLISLISCTSDDVGPPGPPGPQGPQGPQGVPGISIPGQTFGDLDTRNFQYNPEFNLWNVVVQVPNDIEVLESDAILVYRLEVFTDNGEDIETWSLIPQSIFVDQGTIQYSFNHTAEDIELLITGNFDLNNLGSTYTQSQFFKFVVVPSDFAQKTGVDVSDFKAVMSVLEIK